jgi:hypothetical protein
MMNLGKILGSWMFQHHWGIVPEYQLRCLIQGENTPFLLTTPGDTEIGELKREIYNEGCNPNIFGGTIYKDLVVMKVRIA